MKTIVRAGECVTIGSRKTLSISVNKKTRELCFPEFTVCTCSVWLHSQKKSRCWKIKYLSFTIVPSYHIDKRPRDLVLYVCRLSLFPLSMSKVRFTVWSLPLMSWCALHAFCARVNSPSILSSLDCEKKMLYIVHIECESCQSTSDIREIKPALYRRFTLLCTSQGSEVRRSRVR